MKKNFVTPACLMFLVMTLLVSCQSQQAEEPAWEDKLQATVENFGHRNWILVVDKAFPALSSKDIEVVNTDTSMTTVLKKTLDLTARSSHVKPIVYIDQEFAFITEGQIPGIENIRRDLHASIMEFQPRTIAHEEVFSLVTEKSAMFKVLVLKTTEVIPYSSVFIELDCRYWSAEQEKALRDRMTQ
jgi:L-fucose mutarotase/ribose pyranase (RbsD/FucU family)